MSEILDFTSTFKTKNVDTRSKQEKFMERMRNMESVKTKVEHVEVKEETDTDEIVRLRNDKRRKENEIDRLRQQIKSLEESNRSKTTTIEQMNRKHRKSLKEKTKENEKLQSTVLKLEHLQAQYINTIRRNETMYERLKERSTKMIKCKSLKHGMQVVAKRNMSATLREEEHENVLKKLAESMWSERVTILSNENKEMRMLLKSLLSEDRRHRFLNDDSSFSECLDEIKDRLETLLSGDSSSGSSTAIQKELEEAREIIYEQDQLLQTAIFDNDDDENSKRQRRISTPSSDIFALRDMLEHKSKFALEQERIYRENIVPPDTPTDSPLKGVFPTPGTPRTRAILKRIGVCSWTPKDVTNLS